MTLRELTRQRIVSAIQANDHNVSHTAKALGITRWALYRLARANGVDLLGKRKPMPGTPEQKKRAVYMVKLAIANGLEVRPCEVCQSTEDVQAHHDDYARPLAVKWLCVKHHRRLHAMRHESLRDASLIRTFAEWVG